MTISTGDILRCAATLVWSDGNVAMNVFNCLVTGGGGPWTDANVLTDVKTWIDAIYNPLVSDLSDQLDGSQIDGYKWDPVNLDWDDIGFTNWPYLPTDAASQLPRGVAALVLAGSDDPDVNGRKYFPGASETQTINGLWAGSFVANLVLAATAWVTPFTGGVTLATFTPGVWSVKNEVIEDCSGAFTVGTIPAYQRRRKRGVGI